jgi:hypothetical protein
MKPNKEPAHVRCRRDVLRAMDTVNPLSADLPPWRGAGEPWVRLADVVLSLPQWTNAAIVTAVKRLHMEGMIQGENPWTPPHKSHAVRLTMRGKSLRGGGA